MLNIWIAWERFAIAQAHLRPVQEGGILRYNVERYKGPPVRLHDGTTIAPGDRVVAFHVDNDELLRRCTSQEWPPWSALRLAKDDLVVLLERIEAGELGPVKALHGLTLFAAGTRRLGFELWPLPHTWQQHLLRFYLIGLTAVYHPLGWAGADYLRDYSWPDELWYGLPSLRQRAARFRRERERALDA